MDGDGPHRPVRGHDEHLAEVLDIDGAHTLGQGGAGQGRETGDQQHLHDETVPESGSRNTDWPGGFVHPIYSDPYHHKNVFVYYEANKDNTLSILNTL